MLNSQDISVTIYGLDSILYKGKVSALTSVNEKGKFDILPLHSNFISVVKDYLILHQKEGSEKKFKLGQGVLKLTNNEVNIFLGLEGLKE
jgi:F0F1-type ATP synthase epsilon subunit